MSECPVLSDCPVCGARLALHNPLVKGELLTCNACETELEVVGLTPIELEETPQAEEGAEEDWED